MKKLQFLIALWATKASQFLMKLLGRNATYLPGKIAVKLCKDFLAHLTPPKTVVAVTGTNGKTTVSNLISSILKENGYSTKLIKWETDKWGEIPADFGRK